MFSKFFINRPIFATVVSIIIVLAGLVAMISLPIKEYPAVVPPQITVQAVYPGADAKTLATTVSATLEEAINGVENMTYMTSTASPSGVLSLSISFMVLVQLQVSQPTPFKVLVASLLRWCFLQF